MNENEMLHSGPSRFIVGSAMTVLNELRPGLDEKAYGNALAMELVRHGLRIEQQRRFDVRYRGILVDTMMPDLIVNDLVIVDPKVAEEFTETQSAQMPGYLSITKLRLALLLNFKHADLRWKRIVR
jgi:GxxExxY protein